MATALLPLGMTEEEEAAQQTWVSAPLLLKGTPPTCYPALALRFPTAATSGQRRRGQKGEAACLRVLG